MKISLVLLLLACLLLSGCAPAVANASSSAIGAATIETGVDPESWAKIQSGEFLSGQNEHLEQVDHDYEMMVTPVTNAQFARFLNEALAAGAIRRDGERIVGAYPGDPFQGVKHEIEIKAGDYLLIPLDQPELRVEEVGGKFQSRPGYENHPATMITWFGARAYCQFYGWRLPGEAEWERAARGEDARTYPWGDSIDGRYANYYGSLDPFEAGVGKLGDTTPVGYFNGQTYNGFSTQNAASPFGLYDMAGNVWQWTLDDHEGQHYRYLRGGSKADYGYNLRIWTRNSDAPDYFSPNAGFRCAR